MSDLDDTAQASQATISKVDALLGQAKAMLDRSTTEMGEAASTPDLARNFVAKQPADARQQFEAEMKALHEEIERDLPRETATRTARVKPMRQMI